MVAEPSRRFYRWEVNFIAEKLSISPNISALTTRHLYFTVFHCFLSIFIAFIAGFYRFYRSYRSYRFYRCYHCSSLSLVIAGYRSLSLLIARYRYLSLSACHSVLRASPSKQCQTENGANRFTGTKVSKQNSLGAAFARQSCMEV